MNYGYRPAKLTTIGIPQKVPSVADFIVEMQEMLALAKANIYQAMDRAKSYADKDRSFREFEKGEKVFLRIPSNFTFLTLGECIKLFPRY